MKDFVNQLSMQGLSITRLNTKVLQVNLGRLCNLACRHCHVDAGPHRKEVMKLETIQSLLKFLDSLPYVTTLDLTGGAPELNPHFRYLVTEARQRGLQVIDRCNLTVLFEKGQEDTAQFLKDNQVHIVASLPCYSKENVDRQRGQGVFNQSIQALQMLNKMGFGAPQGLLRLDLVYNPGGAVLPPNQAKLEMDYKKELQELFGIVFNNLLTITNMPIQRFLRDLERSNRLDSYMDLLKQNFNSKAAEEVMCRDLISIDWNGDIFDCDFNQMLDLPLSGSRVNVKDVESLKRITDSSIQFSDHCFGCTAGAGSSCGGSLVKQA